MAIKQQVMALNPARKGNMGRLNSSQPLYVYDTLIAQPWLKGVIAQIRGEKAIPGVDAGDEKAVKKARVPVKNTKSPCCKSRRSAILTPSLNWEREERVKQISKDLKT